MGRVGRGWVGVSGGGGADGQRLAERVEEQRKRDTSGCTARSLAGQASTGSGVPGSRQRARVPTSVKSRNFWLLIVLMGDV